MAKKRLYLLYHIAGCLLFLGLAFVLYPHPPELSGERLSRPTQRDFLANAFMLGFFYLNYFILIPRLYFRRRYPLYLLCCAVALLLIVLLPSLITGRVPWHKGHPRGFPAMFKHTVTGPPGTSPGPAQPKDTIGQPDVTKGPADAPGPPDNSKDPSTAAAGPPNDPDGPPDALPGGPHGINPSFFEEISHHIFVFFVVVLFSLLLRVRSRMLIAERQRLDAELVSLKSQINPHFLFNALNSIYSMTVKKEDAAPAAVINLSELMRYMIKDADKAMVPLTVELGYISNYIQLQMARAGNTANINFSLTGDPEGKEIAPLLLIAFIENAFKYGVNPDEESIIGIRIAIEADQLAMQVRNKKVVAASRVESTGVGIANARERLALLYPGKHVLSINDGPEYFFVTLTIALQ